MVLLRPGTDGLEVLLTRRPATMAFGPDIHVFPGGRVEPADADEGDVRRSALDVPLTEREAARRLGLGLAPDGGMTPRAALAHHVAAVRETAEETGIEIRVQELIALTRWVTPDSMARRFDVRFFAAFLPGGADVATRSSEIAETVWMRPDRALDAAVAGALALWQPTFVTLQQLVGLEDDDAVRRAFAPGEPAGGPIFDAIELGRVRVDAPWAAGIPGRRSTGWLIGEREVVVVDPADPTGTTSDAIQAHVAGSGARLVAVVVTDLAPERHAGVEMLAHGLDLPVFGPAEVAARAPYPVAVLGAGARIPFGDVPITLASAATLSRHRTTGG